MGKEGVSASPEVHNVSVLPEFQKTLSVFGMVRDKIGHSGTLYMSGGAVRNALLRRVDTSSDYDLFGDFDLDSIASNDNVVVTNHWPEIGVLKVELDNELVEFISTTNVRQTLASNDVSSSTILLHETGTIEDNFGGLESIRKREIKVNDPNTKFREDPSQIIRVIKFAELLGFEIEEETREAIDETKLDINDATPENLLYEVLAIESLEDRDKSSIINSLFRMGVNVDILSEYRDLAEMCIHIEGTLDQSPVIDTIEHIFPQSNLVLVGGAVRDQIWEVDPNDLDFILDDSMEDTINRLQSLGYGKTNNIILKEMEYYVNNERDVISIFLEQIDIDIACRTGFDINEEISKGDINFSCRVYDVHNKKFINPEIVPEILEKKLVLCAPTRISKDPLLVLSALKQLSRVEDIILTPETKLQIYDGVPKLIQYFRNNPNKMYKLDVVCCNKFSDEVYRLFDQHGGSDLIVRSIRRQSTISDKETQLLCKPDDMLLEEKQEVIALMQKVFGRAFKPEKMKIDTLSSILLVREEGELSTVISMEDSRIYCITSTSGPRLERILIDLIDKNTGLWCTIHVDSIRVQAVFERVGFKRVSDDEELDYILGDQAGKNLNTIGYDHVDSSSTAFYKNSNPEYRQFIYAQQ